MKKLYCVICSKYRKLGKPKNIMRFRKKHQCFLLFAVNVKTKMKKYLKKKSQLKFLIIQKSIRKYIMISEKSMNQEFRLKNIDKIRNYLIGEINRNELQRKRSRR